MSASQPEGRSTLTTGISECFDQPRAQSRRYASHGRAKPGSQDSIQKQICAVQQIGCRRRGEGRFIRRFKRHEFRCLQPLERRPGIALHIVRAPQQQDSDIAASFGQDAGGYESVAAVVAFAAEHHDPHLAAACLPKLLKQKPRYRRTGIVHQRERGDAVLCSRRRVGGAHLCRCQDLHADVGCQIHYANDNGLRMGGRHTDWTCRRY